MFKKILKKLKEVKERKKEKAYPNRFLKFYHLNKKKLNKERRFSYNERKKSGVCVRCKKKTVKGIVFCQYHQEKQKTYNKISRSK
ncbi:MAG: hypothetical protein ABH824_05565 [Nanoarchaeota archaeon]|nr:hypothetical protein [Nanoarchaeota archaeon]MBU1632317.1 hypothetical protein [Nanoarchaeota archaeon]MBU1875876.1 hypothetical protein [Nanoarchaeota archaeon]